MPDRRPILMLIDGPSLVYRGYFALPPLTTSDGTLVNAAFGTISSMLSNPSCSLCGTVERQVQLGVKVRF